jgi:SH3-like domain-containing protein
MAQPATAAPANSAPDDGKGAAGRDTGRVTGLKLPRFVSLKGDAARMRVGPSTDHAVRFVYMAAGLPLELLEEWGNWRLVRDHDGTTGWMHTALLSGRRTAIVAPWRKDGAELRSRPSQDAAVTARMQPGVLLTIGSCGGAWCHATVRNPRTSGHVAQANLWGVYPQEVVE